MRTVDGKAALLGGLWNFPTWGHTSWRATRSSRPWKQTQLSRTHRRGHSRSKGACFGWRHPGDGNCRPWRRRWIRAVESTRESTENAVQAVTINMEGNMATLIRILIQYKVEPIYTPVVVNQINWAIASQTNHFKHQITEGRAYIKHKPHCLNVDFCSKYKFERLVILRLANPAMHCASSRIIVTRKKDV